MSTHPTVPLGYYPTADAVVLERLLPASIEKVWRYLTDPSQMRLWFAGGAVDLRTGGAIHLDFDLIECPGREDVHGTVDGTVTACDPPHLFAFTWGESGSRAAGDPDSLVSFALSPAIEGQTLLTLTHTRIAPKDLSSIGAGWHIHIDVLVDRLFGRQPGHYRNEWYAIEPEYRRLL